MSEQFESFRPDELLCLSYRCPKCNTIVIFSVLTDDQFGVPQRCPTCDQGMEMAAQAFTMYRNFYRLVSQGKIPVRIQNRTE